MVVDRGDLEALLDQLLHHRIHLLLQEHEIAHHHRLLAALLEGEIRAQGKRRLDLYTVEHDREIAASDAHAIHAAGHLRAGSANRFRDRVPLALPAYAERGAEREY